MKNEPLCHAPCPIARSLGRIGDSWSIMILRDAFAGFTRFDEFQKSSNVAPNILSRRLKELVDDGLLEKVCYSSTPPRWTDRPGQAAPDRTGDSLSPIRPAPRYLKGCPPPVFCRRFSVILPGFWAVLAGFFPDFWRF